MPMACAMPRGVAGRRRARPPGTGAIGRGGVDRGGRHRPRGGGSVSGDSDVGQPMARTLAEGGRPALASKGAGGASCRLTRAQLDELQLLLDTGPAEYGWTDQCWTLPRIAAVVRERFGVDYPLPGLDLLLHRIGWSVQVPARRAAERNEERIAAWREESWPAIKGPRRTWAPGWSSRTSPARGSGRPRAAPGAGGGAPRWCG